MILEITRRESATVRFADGIGSLNSAVGQNESNRQCNVLHSDRHICRRTLTEFQRVHHRTCQRRWTCSATNRCAKGSFGSAL
jgi:hypothetical protein